MSSFLDACSAIEHAGVEREVVVAVQRFLAAVPESERAHLPWGLYAQPVANVGDLALWTFELDRDRSGTENSGGGPAYGQAVEVFKRATARLVEIRRLDVQARLQR